MAELVFVMPVLGIIFLAMYQLYLICDTKHNVIQSARYTAFGRAYSNVYPNTSRDEMKPVIINNILKNNQSEYEGWVTLTHYQINETKSYNSSTGIGMHIDPVTIAALELAGHAFDGHLNNKYECRVEAEIRLRYLDPINQLAKVLGKDTMTIAPIRLVDSLVIIGNDWSSKTKKEFAGRVGVPSSKSHYIDMDKGLWMYPIGGTVGAVFTTINSIFGTIVDAIGWLFPGSIDDPIDPRGDYFEDNNDHSPDYVS